MHPLCSDFLLSTLSEECVILGLPHFSEEFWMGQGAGPMTTTENLIERDLISKLEDLKYTYRPDIRDRAALEKNFREKFETLNRIRLTDAEFQSLLEQIITPDVFAAAKLLRERTSFTRDDGTPLNYTLVNINDWCKNTFEVVNQLRINTDNSHQRYDVILLINGVPVVQIELKSLGISPRLKSPFEGMVLKVVGFKPCYVNQVVVQQPCGCQGLLRLRTSRRL
jgi:hypothetical protein